MGLRVIEERTRRTGPGEAVVCIEGNSLQEVISRDAKKLACDTAAEKFALGTVAHGSEEGPYRPMADGRPAETPEDMKLLQQETLLRGGKVQRWRKDYNLVKSSF